MVNSQVVREVTEAFKIDRNVEALPQAIPTVEVGVKSTKEPYIISNYRILTGNLAGTVIPEGFYLMALQFGLVKDATCDVATGRASITAATAQGTVELTNIPILTLTAQEFNVFVDLKHPLKINAGSSITSSLTYTAGLMSRSYILIGYIDEVT